MATQLTMITAAETRRCKADLRSKLNELADVPTWREELYIDQVADSLDQIQSSTGREITVQRLDHQTRQMNDIQSALAKIENGTYGLYERCDEPIPRRRLALVPWAPLCVRCQSAEEAPNQNGESTFADPAGVLRGLAHACVY